MYYQGPPAVIGHSCCGVPTNVLSICLFVCFFGEANKIPGKINLTRKFIINAFIWVLTLEWSLMETVANKNFSFTSTWPLGDLMSIMIFDSFPREVACVASVSNWVIARKLERKQNFVPLPLPRHSVFFLLLSQLSRRTSWGNACYAG